MNYRIKQFVLAEKYELQIKLNLAFSYVSKSTEKLEWKS